MTESNPINDKPGPSDGLKRGGKSKIQPLVRIIRSAESPHHAPTFRHTLGNLTLTGYNSEYSNSAFIAKCEHEYGFKFSPLKMNEGIAAETRWDEVAIKKRANRLAEKATKVWANAHSVSLVVQLATTLDVLT